MAALDGDPASRVDWAGGRWIGYEDEDGNANDVGGRDCKIVVYVASDENATPPASRDVGCSSAQAPAPPPANGGGGGGGGLVLWLLPFLLIGAWRQRRRR